MGTTTNYSWVYPTVNADADAWGTILNNMAIAIDASLKTVDTSVSAKLAKASNLSDLASASTARTNLGLGNASILGVLGGQSRAATISPTFSTGHFVKYDTDGSLIDANLNAGSFCQTANNLSDVGSASTSRTNLGLGSIATHNVTISTSAPSGGSDGDFWYVYV